MPIGARHHQQKRKNLALLAILLGLIAVLFTVTLLKMSL